MNKHNTLKHMQNSDVYNSNQKKEKEEKKEENIQLIFSVSDLTCISGW